jgi:hypothetical protein
MHISTAANCMRDSAQAARAAARDALSQLGGPPKLLLVHASSRHDFRAVADGLSELAPDVPVHGSSSCRGVMTERGFFADGLGVLCVADDKGSFGVGGSAAGSSDESTRAAATNALLEALARAGRSGEVPDLIWLTAPPGREELVLQGIADLVGSEVPVVGGSSADDDASGHWKQLANGTVYEDAVVVSALFASQPLSLAFQSGYTPTDCVGRVTEANNRTLSRIDERPAAEVYNEWTGGLIDEELKSTGSVFRKTTLAPLGRIQESPSGVPRYLLAHPESVLGNGALTVFARVKEGERICLMRGSSDGLLARAERVARTALDLSEPRIATAAGALVIYCGGCMLTVEAQMGRVAAGLNEALRGAPFLGLFSFGEQGAFVPGDNRHSNLMVSVVTFGDGHA